MISRSLTFCLFCFACLALCFSELTAQEPGKTPQIQPPGQAAGAANPPVQEGVEVLARGPIHEAFASPTAEPVPSQVVNKAPPKPIDEMPPAEKPSGDAAWIGGYWAWDDDRHDYLWVSGIWRSPPPGKKWVAGYWKQDGQEHRWVPGFWTANAATTNNAELHTPQDQITYLPAPPTAPQTAPPGQAPNAESFYVPGHWEWRAAGYQTVGEAQEFRPAGYAWVPGYWAKVQPGYVWVAAHYTWTPTGYVYVAGYWDLAVANRGVIYAPVIIDPVVVGPHFVYTPAYIVRDTVVIDNLWVRPCFGHYYFGDYYGGVYAGIGFQSAFVYSSVHYDPIIAYARYENRNVANWNRLQIDLVFARNAGRAPLPPRTLVQQNVIVNNVTNVTNVTNVNKTVVNNTNVNNTNVSKTTNMLAPANQLASVKGVTTTSLSPTAQAQAKQQAQSIQQVSSQRSAIEAKSPPGGIQGPRTTAMTVPTVNAVTAKGLAPMNSPPTAKTNPGIGGTGGQSAMNNNAAARTNGVPGQAGMPNNLATKTYGAPGQPGVGNNPGLKPNTPTGPTTTKMGQTKGVGSSYQKGAKTKGPSHDGKQ